MRIDQRQLSLAVKDFYGLKDEMPSGFLLNQGNGANSLGRARFGALLRKQGVLDVNLQQIKTWEELCNHTSGKNSVIRHDGHSETMQPKATQFTSNGIGIDIELISRFPVINDYWTDSFYCDNFSLTEIAYCVRQEQPTEHFAGRWCLKEGLVKCFHDLVGVKFSDIEISMRDNNQLIASIRINNEKKVLPVRVSISHTQDYAIGVVIVHTNASQPSEEIKKIQIRSEQEVLVSSMIKKWKCLSVFAIIFAAMSFLYTWMH